MVSKSLVACAALCALSCGNPEPDQRSQSHELTSDQIAVLGFERPTVDWSSTSGGVSESTTVTQGSKALAANGGYREITSVSLSSLGGVKSTLRLDVRLPAAVNWGDVRVVLVAPSLSMGWTDLGGKSLSTLPVGQYSTLTFQLPSGVETALEGTYSDLRLKVILNAPDLGSPYLFDNLDFADGTAPPASGSNEQQIAVVVPQGQTRASMFLSASNYLQVDDRVEIGLAGTLTNVAGLSSPGAQFGSALNGHTNVFSVGNVWLRSQAVVDGFVRTQGIITKQDATVHITGAEQAGVDVPTRTFGWAVAFPPSATPLNVIGTGANVALDPGAYQSFNQHGGRVSLRTGTYYFDSFSTEPAAVVNIDNAGGPVLIYVKNGFTFKGPFIEQEREGQVLVGHLGSSPAVLQAPFLGTIVAPNGKVELQRPNGGLHRGSFFAKDVQVFSDSHILHVPFDWGTLEDDGPPDTDGDGTDDLIDRCLLDANKTKALLCGCNKPEDDDDTDLVPQCWDYCPEDPNNTHPGPCGCIGQDNLQPAGVRCVVEACSGSRQEATCDGQGQCGEPDCDPEPDGCFYKVFKDSLYWFCEGPVGWEQAESLCNAEPGRHLVKVDDRLENLWLSTVAGADTWLGGSDLVLEERWTWSRNGNRNGPLFWVNGLPVRGLFESWQEGGPRAEHCLRLGENGVWSDASCTENKGFICEQPLRKLPPKLEPVCPCDFFPNVSCASCGESVEPVGPCVPGNQEFGNDFQAVKDKAANCAALCSEADYAAGTPDCLTHCSGFAEPPPENVSCNEFTDVEKALCDLETVHPDPGETCSIDDPSCPAGYFCGRRHECAALNANFESVPCTVNENCDVAAGHYCGGPLSVCIDPNLKGKCDTKNGDECVGLCFGSFACGTVDPACAADDNGELTGRCNRTEICPDPGTVDLDGNPFSDLDSNLDPQGFPAETLFPEPAETAQSFPIAKPDGCGAEDEEPDCVFDIGEHPWCKFELEPGQGLAEKPISDSDAPFDDKQGKGGGAGPVRFDFDPNLSVTYHVPEPLPLGDARFSAKATASAAATAHFSLFGIGGDVSIIDAGANLGIDRCGVVADARLSIFGHDFLPAILGDTAQELEDIDTTQPERDKCEATIGEFEKAVNRAQKALRDAQELMRQQKEIVATGGRFSPDLCEQLLGSASRGLPADFPSAEEPFAGCGDLSPEDTINLFIRYYRQQVYALAAKQASLFLEGAPQLAPEDLKIDFLDDVDSSNEIDESRRETQQIANIPFAIGPIPMSLTIEAFLQYGLAGDLTFSLTPDALLQAYDATGREELAFVDASISPFAGAGVSMFVGVGVDWGAFSAKLGISGDVSLGLVSLPMYAGAGIGVEAEEDDRALPGDLLDKVSSGQSLFPPGPAKKYRFDAHYKFGADVDIEDILNGTISAKLKIKFLFFSKTWSKKIAEISSGIDPIHIDLISGSGDVDFADSWGILGQAVRMPVPFVDLQELDTPPPLPPLPDPNGGAGGMGGTGGSGGSSTGGTGGSGGEGNRPPVSLLVDGDPRFKNFYPGRVDELFYAGYCECSTGPGGCSADLDCCGGSFCVSNDETNESACLACAPALAVDIDDILSGQFPEGPICDDTSECCGSGSTSDPNVCLPFVTGGNKHCQKCRERNEPAFDNNRDGFADFDECCDGDTTFRPPLNGVQRAGAPICNTGCRNSGESCNTVNDCCPPGPLQLSVSCLQNSCSYVDVPR
jgi:hypothetical protein